MNQKREGRMYESELIHHLPLVGKCMLEKIGPHAPKPGRRVMARGACGSNVPMFKLIVRVREVAVW